MPQFTYHPGESKYDVLPGTYRVRYKGARDREPFKGPSKFGTPSDEPRVEWQFEVQEGASLGKLVCWTTGTDPSSPKSNCYKVVRWLLGREPTAGEFIDTEACVGRLYELTWAKNPNSTSGNCWIEHLRLLDDTPASPFAKPAEPLRANGGSPPPRKPNGHPALPWEGKKFWVDLGKGQPELTDGKDLQDWFQATGTEPANLDIAPEGGNEWRPASEFGFKQEIPF